MINKLVRLLPLLFVVTTHGYAIDDPSMLTEKTEVRDPKPSPKMARMRMKVKITPYQKLLVKDRFGNLENNFKPTTSIERNLRARIDHANHFYIDQWHIESVPQAWSSDTKTIKFKLRIYKLYGKHKSLEQSIGTLDAEGTLSGENYVFNFSGNAKGKYSNVLGDPVVEIEVSEPGKLLEDVAKSTESTPKIKDSF